MNEFTKGFSAMPNGLSEVSIDEQVQVEGGAGTMTIQYQPDTSSMANFYQSVVDIATFHRSLFPK
jgi:hypothetical protein